MSEEISLSVEESNALRKSLGLKPLRATKDKLLESKGEPELYVAAKTVPIKSEDDDIANGRRLLETLSSGGGILDMFDTVPEPKKAKIVESSSEESDSSDS